MKKANLLPLIISALLAAACQSSSREGAADTTGRPKDARSTAESRTPAAKETPTANPFTLPSLEGRTQDSAVALLRDHRFRLGLITNRAARKEASLPTGENFGGWVICSTEPAPGSWITDSTEIALYLAETASACVNATPNSNPKKTHLVPVPSTKNPRSSGPRTCSNDGSQTGYACTSSGKVVVEGEYCAKADRGETLKATNGRMATCEHYNGWRWNA